MEVEGGERLMIRDKKEVGGEMWFKRVEKKKIKRKEKGKDEKEWVGSIVIKEINGND